MLRDTKTYLNIPEKMKTPYYSTYYFKRSNDQKFKLRVVTKRRRLCDRDGFIHINKVKLSLRESENSNKILKLSWPG